LPPNFFEEMMLLGQESIRDVILFPHLKPK